LREVCNYSTFILEIRFLYERDDLQDVSFHTFSYIPLAAKIICVHGGICPGIDDLSIINSLQRPIETYWDFPLNEILWSDPANIEDNFSPSERGIGHLFSSKSLSGFIQANDFTTMIRGHQRVFEGVKRDFLGSLITVFSASNYCNYHRNHAGVVFVSSPTSIVSQNFPPLPYLKRN
jgi:serine/threonine-protein phosphatase PP1 catalytic subunit